jgi:hypothetical protein
VSKRFLASLVVLAVSLPLLSWEWPVAKRVVTGNFGESREDHFHAGIDIGGGEQAVHPILDGELVFRYDEDGDFASLPRGVGSFLALQHTGKYLSLYCHLKKESIPRDKVLFTAGDTIGTIGDTGFSEGKHLHIAVFDVQAVSFINPLIPLPPLADRQPPVIKGIVLKRGATTAALSPGSIVTPGQAEILAEIYDPREDVRYLWPMAPYSIRLALNGKEAAKIVFDSLQVKDGKMVVGGTRLSAADVYSPDSRLIRCGIVELRGGESHLLLAARDFAGNETVKEIFFTVSE